MNIKKKIISTIFALALIAAIIIPKQAIMAFFGIESISLFVAKLLMFFVISTCAFCWLGAPAGWRLARENGLREGGMLILAFLGIYASFFVALYQLTIDE